MRGIKESPTNFRIYYHLLINNVEEKRKDIIEKINTFNSEITILYNSIANNIPLYKKQYGIDIEKSYLNPNNININKIVKLIVKAEKEESEDLIVLARICKKAEQVYYMTKRLEIYNKVLDLSMKQYADLLNIYFTEVHKQMVINGYGYHISNVIGTVCFYRIKNLKTTKYIDFGATNKKRKEILARGGRVYDAKEEAWCKERGIEYKYEDHKVYKHDEYIYDTAILYCKLKSPNGYKFTPADYRHVKVRGKSNQEMIEECNNDKYEIIKLPVDIKTKLTLCLQVDNTLYNKFIRNENQTSIAFKSANSED